MAPVSSSNLVHAVIAATQREQLLRPMGSRAEHARSADQEGSLDVPDKLAALLAMARLFDEEGIAYALIGGLAVGIRSGLPRATLDIDFAIPTGVDKASLTEKMTARGFRPTGRFAHSLNFRHESGEPVQLAFDPAFDAMIARAERLPIDDGFVSVVTREDLIAMKRRAAADPGRRRSKALRDQADIALLEGDVPDEDEGW